MSQHKKAKHQSPATKIYSPQNKMNQKT